MFNRYSKWLRPGVCALALVSLTAIAAEGDDKEEIKDSLGRARDRGLLNVCADPYQYPQSEQNADPPGFDVEIVRSIAKSAGLRLNMVWINTASRGGTSRAFRQSILAGKCDVFLGMSDNGDDDNHNTADDNHPAANDHDGDDPTHDDQGTLHGRGDGRSHKPPCDDFCPDDRAAPRLRPDP